MIGSAPASPALLWGKGCNISKHTVRNSALSSILAGKLRSVGGEPHVDKKGLDRTHRKIIEIMPKDFSAEPALRKRRFTIGDF